MSIAQVKFFTFSLDNSKDMFLFFSFADPTKNPHPCFYSNFRGSMFFLVFCSVIVFLPFPNTAENFFFTCRNDKRRLSGVLDIGKTKSSRSKENRETQTISSGHGSSYTVRCSTTAHPRRRQLQATRTGRLEQRYPNYHQSRALSTIWYGPLF